MCHEGATVVLLDGACLAQWSRFFAPCMDSANPVFELTRKRFLAVGDRVELPILRHRDVCERAVSGTPWTCARSLLLKQQPFLLGKVVTQAFYIPAMSSILMDARPLNPKDAVVCAHVMGPQDSAFSYLYTLRLSSWRRKEGRCSWFGAPYGSSSKSVQKSF